MMNFRTATTHVISANGATEAERDAEYAYLVSNAQTAFPNDQIAFDAQARSVTVTIQKEAQA